MKKPRNNLVLERGHYPRMPSGERSDMTTIHRSGSSPGLMGQKNKNHDDKKITTTALGLAGAGIN